MENPLTKYLNKSYKIVEGLSVKEGTTKDGSKYVYCELQFTNGFSKRFYPNDAERFALINAIDMQAVQKTIDDSF